MNFGRHEDECLERRQLPMEWLEELTKTLNDVYSDQRDKDQRFFETYGEIYEKDFVVIISYLHKQDSSASPITLFLSHDNLEDSKQFKKALSSLTDLVGLIFDDVVSQTDWNEYNLNWTENEFKGFKFFYKLTRENISLTLQAEELLKESNPTN